METKRFFVFSWLYWIHNLSPNVAGTRFGTLSFCTATWQLLSEFANGFGWNQETSALMRGNFWAISVPAFPALKKAPSSCWKQPLKYNWWFRRVNAEFRTLRKWASSPQIAAWSCHTINQQHPAIISWYQQISHRFRSFNPSNWLARLFKNTLTLNNSIFQCPEIKIVSWNRQAQVDNHRLLFMEKCQRLVWMNVNVSRTGGDVEERRNPTKQNP